MCGIAGIHIKHPETGLSPRVVDSFVNSLLLGIEHRGGDATGMVAVTAGGKRVVLHKEAETASKFIQNRPSVGGMSELRTVLLHTRFATQGHQSNNANNHPVLYKTCFATHNGHIGNDEELFTEYGLDRRAEVDSEVIAALFSEHGLDAAHRALQVLEGNMAVAVIDPIAAPDKLVLAKGIGSPLFFFENGEFIIWASTLDALITAWGTSLGTPPKAKRFWELQEGQLMLVEGDTKEIFKFKPKKRTYRYVSKEWDESSSWSNSSCYTGGCDTNIESLASAKSRFCKSCGCSAFWHAGSEYAGNCMNKPTGMHIKQCRCEGFVAIEKDETMPDLVMCDACYESFPDFVMEELYTDFFMCEGCLGRNELVDEHGFISKKECGHRYCGKECGYRKSLALALVSSRECAHEGCPGDTCQLGVEVFEEEAEPAIWVPNSNEERQEAITAHVAADTGHNEIFIKWVLFEAEIDVLNSDSWLKVAKETIDKSWAEVEDKFNALEADYHARRELVSH